MKVIEITSKVKRDPEKAINVGTFLDELKLFIKDEDLVSTDPETYKKNMMKLLTPVFVGVQESNGYEEYGVKNFFKVCEADKDPYIMIEVGHRPTCLGILINQIDDELEDELSSIDLDTEIMLSFDKPITKMDMTEYYIKFS